MPLSDHPEGDSMCRIVVVTCTRVITRDATEDGRFDYSSFVQERHPRASMRRCRSGSAAASPSARFAHSIPSHTN